MIDFDDFDWKDGVIIGSFWDYISNDEKEEEKRRREAEEDVYYDPLRDEDEPYP